MVADPDAPEPIELNYAVAHEAVAAAVPDRPCILWGDRRFTWADVTDRTRRLAAVLGPGRIADERTIDPWESPHRHVALYLVNGNEYLEGMLGAWKARWAAVNVNYRYVTDELVHVLGDAEVEAIVYHGRFAATLAEVLPRLPRTPRPSRSTTPTVHRCCPAPPGTRPRWRRRRPSRRPAARPTTATSSTRAAPPVIPRACCGARPTSSPPAWA